MPELRVTRAIANQFKVVVSSSAGRHEFPVQRWEVREHGLVPIIDGKPAPIYAFADWRLEHVPTETLRHLTAEDAVLPFEESAP